MEAEGSAGSTACLEDLSPSLVSTALLESRQVRFCEQFGLRSSYQLLVSEDGTMGEAVRVYHPCQGSPL